MRLFLLFLLVPIVEIGLFIEIGGLIGTWPTIGIVVLTAVLGSSLMRRQGLQAMRDLQSRLGAGEAPGEVLADGAMILFAGALLLTPGFFTDSVGFALLIPAVRRALWRRIAARVAVGTSHAARTHWRVQDGDTVVEGEFTEIRPDPPERPDPPVNRPDPPSIGRRGDPG